MAARERLVKPAVSSNLGTKADDNFVFDGRYYKLYGSSSTGYTGTIDGAGGYDTLVLRPNGKGYAYPTGLTTDFNLKNVTIRNVQGLTFDTAPNEVASFQLGIDQVRAQVFHVMGGAGRDSIDISAVGEGNVAMPLLTFENWSTGTTIRNAEYVRLTGSADVDARDDFASVQRLISIGSGASLTGSNGRDILTVTVTGAGNHIASGGGDDLIELASGLGTPLVLSNVHLDGGDGIDMVRLFGPIKLVSLDIGNVELVHFGLFSDETLSGASASLTLDTVFSDTDPIANVTKPTAVTFSGKGSFTVNLDSGTSFDGSGIAFDPKADILFAVNGSASGDKITGSRASDLLTGNSGDDVLSGGAGNDQMVGNQGRDDLTGGIGADIFSYGAISDSGPGSDRDVIRDFRHSDGDKIDLHAIDANLRLAGDQAFFLGGQNFTRSAGEIVQVASGGNLTLRADVDGDGSADFSLLLMKVVSPLTADDFVL